MESHEGSGAALKELAMNKQKEPSNRVVMIRILLSFPFMTASRRSVLTQLYSKRNKHEA